MLFIENKYITNMILLSDQYFGDSRGWTVQANLSSQSSSYQHSNFYRYM